VAWTGLLLAWAGTAYCQDLGQYLALRRQHGIASATTPAALETMVGSRVLEVSGVVRGSARVGDSAILLIEANEADLPVRATALPEWLGRTGQAARLLIRAERPAPAATLRAELLGAAPEGDMRRWEQEQRARHARRATPASRGGAGRPPPLPGEVRTIPRRDWQLPASEATPYYAAFIRRVNRRLSAEQAQEIAEGIVGFSIRYGVDARLIMAMVMVESGFDPNATSHRGAMGLGQLMPGTAAGMGVTDAYDTTENLWGTVRLVRGHLERFTARSGDSYEGLVLALAAYNAGSGAVRRHGGVPPFRETRNYIRRVIELYRRFAGG
jgi:soluble lytic murein transglycosylase-like protein